MYTVVLLATRNVVKNWRHSLAATLSIAIGFVAFVLFEGYVAHLGELYLEVFSRRQMLGDLVIEKAGAQQAGLDDPWAYQLTERDQAVIDGHLSNAGSHVTGRVRFLNTTGVVSNGKSSVVFAGVGYDVSEGARMRGPRWARDAAVGRPLQSVDAEEVVLGKGLGRAVECEANGTELRCRRPHMQLTAMTASGQLNAVEPDVVGLVDVSFKELDARHIRMPLGLAQQLLDTKQVSLYSVRLADHTTASPFAQQLRASARSQGVMLDVSPWQEHPRLGDLYRRTMSLLSVFETFIISVVVAVAGMSVLNAMVKSVSERTREIGLLRSLGFKRKHIVSMFVLEGVLLSLFASMMGLAISIALTVVVNTSGITYSAGMLSEPIQLAIALRPPACLAASALLLVVASLAAWRPARRAASLKIANALTFV